MKKNEIKRCDKALRSLSISASILLLATKAISIPEKKAEKAMVASIPMTKGKSIVVSMINALMVLLCSCVAARLEVVEP